MDLEFLKLSITFWLVVVDCASRNKEGDPLVARSCGGVLRYV
jgi:hypothetical protein